METLIYLLKVNVAIAVFYLIYRLFYRKDTFFSMRRFLLQSMLFLSAIYPLMDFSRWMMRSTTLSDMATSYINILPEITVYKSGAMAKSGFFASHSYGDYFLWLYAAVTCVLLLRILIRISQVLWLRIQSKPAIIENMKVYCLDKDVTPFSFFSWVFINPALLKDKELHEVLTHEMVHVDQRHSYDIIFSEIICAFCWINPFTWMLSKEIHKNLEFIVDNCVVKNVSIDKKSYQYHLLRLAYHPVSVTIANQFNVSPLKERIMMLNVKKSPKIKLVAYVLVLPLVLLFLVANNAAAVVDRISQNNEMASISAFVSDKVVSDGITGRIVNEETKQPMPGVNVIVRNSTNGTITDIDGYFKLTVNKGDTITFSFVGFESLNYIVKKTALDIGTLSLSRNVVSLDGVVVVGYKSDNETTAQKIITDDEKSVFVTVEKMPEFKGGTDGLLKYLSEHVIYPETAAQKGIQGRVFCQFVVEDDGSVDDVRVLKNIDPDLDAEAVRVISSMPKWKPGEQRGKPVSVVYSLPITFSLQGKNENTVLIKINKKDMDKMSSVKPKPIVYVDGQELAYDKINEINPNNIDNISVLKDSTAIKEYGDNGKNGVIIINTKDNLNKK